MDIHEHQAKDILKGNSACRCRRAGSPTRPNRRPTEAASWAVGFPCVVKAQIHSGGRGEVGGVKVCKIRGRGARLRRRASGQDAGDQADRRAGKTVHRLWVEEATDIAQEIYLGFVLDRKSERIMIVASGHGGMEIEDLAHEDPDSLVRMVIDPAGAGGVPGARTGLPPRAQGQADRPDGDHAARPATAPIATSMR
jgi:malate-CoA ligase subunit beta